MKDLIKALQILLKYGNETYPTVCVHDELIIVGINPKIISTDDKSELVNLGFIIQISGEKIEDEEDEYYEEDKIFSYKYGSA